MNTVVHTTRMLQDSATVQEAQIVGPGGRARCSEPARRGVALVPTHCFVSRVARTWFQCSTARYSKGAERLLERGREGFFEAVRTVRWT